MVGILLESIDVKDDWNRNKKKRRRPCIFLLAIVTLSTEIEGE